MKIQTRIPKSIAILTEEQRHRFREYLPCKVYKTERNISILVALSQLSMIIMFLANKSVTIKNIRSLSYFLLYVFLLLTTGVALVLYRYTFHGKRYKAFARLRRIYAALLCVWVLGITFLEQMGGKGLSVYCYLLPTTAALLLFTPIESTIIFGGTWVALACMMISTASEGNNIFGNMVNSIFVTVLSLFISYRYYRSMAVEFCDRETIARQYDEIQHSNTLLQKMVHMDQLTGLYNRHYLLERIYPIFDESRKKNDTGMLLMMDIDYFKQYNDTYGHMQGDECLKQIACILKEFCADNDANAIRYGGEEFLVVKMDAVPFDGIKLAKKLLQNIWDAQIVRTDVAIGRVTVSIGIWSGNMAEVEHVETGIKNADKALYEAKSSGRNRIVKAEAAKRSGTVTN